MEEVFRYSQNHKDSLRLERTLEVTQSHPSSSCRATKTSGSCPDGFWVSPRLETPHLNITSFLALNTLFHKRFTEVPDTYFNFKEFSPELHYHLQLSVLLMWNPALVCTGIPSPFQIQPLGGEHPKAGSDPKGKFPYTAFGNSKISLQSFQRCHLSHSQTEEEIALS